MSDNTEITQTGTAQPEPVDTSSLDMVFDWMNELGDDETHLLFDILKKVDPLEQRNGEYLYTPSERELLAEALRVYAEAGFDE